MNADGSGLVNLSRDVQRDFPGSLNEFLPAWSPDGTKIAFASNINGAWDAYVMDADGSKRVRLSSFDSGAIRTVTWSSR